MKTGASISSGNRQPVICAFDDAMRSIGYFEHSPQIAVAVSGGADSMALLLLAHEWATQKNGCAIALTVDHGLRKASAAEARQVALWCKNYNISHHMLATEDWRPETGIQEKARSVRYTLLTDWCRQHKVLHLLTAHHAGDQAETLLFRLARGSFIEGLSCIPAVSTRNGVRLIRPLLGLSKSALESFLHERHQPWITDPSNQNPAYTRNRIRHSLDSEQYDAPVFNLTQRIAVIRNRLEQALAADLCQNVTLFPDGTAWLRESVFKSCTPHQSIKLLSALVQTVGGDDTQPRTEQLQRLYQDLQSLPKKRSLGNALFSYHKKNHSFRVEVERKAPHITQVKPLKPLAAQAFLGLNRDLFL